MKGWIMMLYKQVREKNCERVNIPCKSLKKKKGMEGRRMGGQYKTERGGEGEKYMHCMYL